MRVRGRAGVAAERWRAWADSTQRARLDTRASMKRSGERIGLDRLDVRFDTVLPSAAVTSSRNTMFAGAGAIQRTR